jgi:hypothetical protein
MVGALGCHSIVGNSDRHAVGVAKALGSRELEVESVGGPLRFELVNRPSVALEGLYFYFGVDLARG